LERRDAALRVDVQGLEASHPPAAGPDDRALAARLDRAPRDPVIRHEYVRVLEPRVAAPVVRRREHILDADLEVGIVTQLLPGAEVDDLGNGCQGTDVVGAPVDDQAPGPRVRANEPNWNKAREAVATGWFDHHVSDPQPDRIYDHIG
jgi:hypothetical protein